MQGMQVTRKKEKKVMKSDMERHFSTAPCWLKPLFAVSLSILGSSSAQYVSAQDRLDLHGSLCLSRLTLSFTVQFLCSDLSFSVSFEFLCRVDRPEKSQKSDLSHSS